MELVSGTRLDLVAPRPSAAQVAAWGVQLADAVDCLASRDVTLLDLKPANILVGEDGPVLVDLVSLPRDREREHVDGLLSSGTPRYAAPEQWSGRGDSRSDIFALGLLLLEVVGLEGHVGQATATKRRTAIDKAMLSNLQISTEFRDVLAAAVALEPEDRWSSAQSLRGAIQETPEYLAGQAGD